jgi:inhibitor of the pro-sigma K processing machinery
MDVIGMLLAFGAGLLLLYFLGMLFVVPMKWLVRLIINSLIGFVVLTALNFIAEPLFQFTIPLNLVNLLIAGLLGVPGVILLVIFRLFL